MLQAVTGKNSNNR